MESLACACGTASLYFIFRHFSADNLWLKKAGSNASYASNCFSLLLYYFSMAGQPVVLAVFLPFPLRPCIQGISEVRFQIYNLIGLIGLFNPVKN
jgi:hypothetical protein